MGYGNLSNARVDAEKAKKYAAKYYEANREKGKARVKESISMPKGHGFALTPYKGALGIINAIP